MKTINKIKILNDNLFEIGREQYKVFYRENPRKHEYKYYIEADGNDLSKFRQHLSPYNLSQITPEELPDSIRIKIDWPKAQFKNVIFVEYHRTSDVYTLEYTAYIDYSDWKENINLFKFVEKFIEDLKKRNASIINTYMYRETDSVYFVLTKKLQGDDDCLQTYLDLDKFVDNTYHSILTDRDTNLFQNKSENKEVETEKYKWWIRFVIVPIICSGTFAALVAWLVVKGKI